MMVTYNLTWVKTTKIPIWCARRIESIIGVEWGQKENPNLRAHRSSGKRGLPVGNVLVTSLMSMFTVNDARCTNKLETASNSALNKEQMDLQELAYQPQ